MKKTPQRKVRKSVILFTFVACKIAKEGIVIGVIGI